MREFKFRAWDKEVKMMRDGFSERSERFCIWSDGMIEDCGLERNNKWIVMQFTGLHDKNGKRIYEGDIVIFHQFLFDGNEIESTILGVIEYKEDVSAYCLSRIKNKFYEKYTGYWTGEGSSPLCDFYGTHELSYEIIGNIHENPELLE